MGKTIEKRIADPIDFANEEWSVSNETPSTIITPHGRVGISWTCTTGVMDAKAEAAAARIVAYHRACSAMPDPAKGVEALKRVALAAMEVQKWGPTDAVCRLEEAAWRRLNDALAACGEVTEREEGRDG